MSTSIAAALSLIRTIDAYINASEPFKVAKETLRSHQAPEWLSIDPSSLTGSVVTPPSRDQMPLDLNEQLVVEYYSR